MITMKRLVEVALTNEGKSIKPLGYVVQDYKARFGELSFDQIRKIASLYSQLEQMAYANTLADYD